MSKGGQISGSIPFPDEIAHLSEINLKLEAALKKAEAAADKSNQQYRDEKRYMAEYRGEIDPHEMFQNELLLKQTDQMSAVTARTCDKLAKLKDSPYFARIDFQSQDCAGPEKFYIGKFTFHYESEILIFDWRAPVASMFYDYETGPAGYDAPDGRIEGELVLKRQFKIHKGVMEYALESASHVQDDILQKELSHTADQKMKSIISTIQKEQNQIIRNEEAGTLIIQGVAGSGKTSIALHRIAFLLYRFKDRISARNVTILSPNKVFGDYISNVIPELGEEPIYELSFYELAQIELAQVIGFERDEDPLEAQDSQWKERTCFKSTMEFAAMLESYTDSMSDWVFRPGNYVFGGFHAESQWIKKRFDAYRKHPVKLRLSMVADDIYHRFESENIRQEEIPGVRIILRDLTRMLNVKSTLPLYKEFYRSIGRQDLFVMPAKKTLEWADVYPFLYLYMAFEGGMISHLTKHLVIDEMQDYTPIQYAVVNRLFPCQKTILGDFGQCLNPFHSHTLADIKKFCKDAGVVELNRSYRSTYEIMSFAKRVGNIASLEAVERHGEEPSLKVCKNEQDELQQMNQIIQNADTSLNTTLGIILKTNTEAKKIYELLRKEFPVNLISPDSTHYGGGISVVSIQMAKGLEFDEVIIPQADSQTYDTEYDRSLLYIACTRAMHRLTLLYTKEPSRFLEKAD